MGVMTGIGLGLAIYGAVRGAKGEHDAGKAAKEAGESQAQQLEFNARVAELQATDAEQRGLEEEQRFRTGVRLLVGQQRAGFAGQGVDVGSGSAADVQADSAFLGELDARQIRANAAREAWGYRVDQADLLKGAEVSRKGGVAAQRAHNTAAVTQVIGTGSSLLMSRYGWSEGR